MTLNFHPSPVDDLVRRLDAAMDVRDDAVRSQKVKRVLEETVGRGEPLLGERFLTPTPLRYARRLLHSDPEGRYTVLVMVWDREQGTPLHDHGGVWCVECVYRGRIRVTSYSLRGGDPKTAVVQFHPEEVVLAGIAEAGALIPPFEYHKIENPDDTPAITLHVYGGAMTSCHVFEPVEGEGFRRKFRELYYTP